MSPSLFGRVMKLEPAARHDLLEFVGGSELSEVDIVKIVDELEGRGAPSSDPSTQKPS